MRDLPKSTTHVVKKASDIFVYGSSTPKPQVPPPKPATNPRINRLTEGIKTSPARQFMVSELSSTSEEGEDGRGFSVDDILSDVQTAGSSSSSTSEVEPDEEDDEDDTSGAGHTAGGEELSIDEESSSPRVVKRNGGGGSSGKMAEKVMTLSTSSLKQDGSNGGTRLDQLRDGKTQGGFESENIRILIV